MMWLTFILICYCFLGITSRYNSLLYVGVWMILLGICHVLNNWMIFHISIYIFVYSLTWLVLRGFVFISNHYSEHKMIEPEGPSRVFNERGNWNSELGDGAHSSYGRCRCELSMNSVALKNICMFKVTLGYLFVFCWVFCTKALWKKIPFCDYADQLNSE